MGFWLFWVLVFVLGEGEEFVGLGVRFGVINLIIGLNYFVGKKRRWSLLIWWWGFVRVGVEFIEEVGF